MKLMERTLPQPYPCLHLALIPFDCDPKLNSSLSALNIETLAYDPSNNHDFLWESVKIAQHEIRTEKR